MTLAGRRVMRSGTVSGQPRSTPTVAVRDVYSALRSYVDWTTGDKVKLIMGVVDAFDACEMALVPRAALTDEQRDVLGIPLRPKSTTP